MKIHFIRHATICIEYNGKQILVDPMLSAAGAMDTVPNAANTLRNPLVELPIQLDRGSKDLGADAVLVTHLHRDHFDQAAIEYLSKDLKLFCQPHDQASLENYGFRNTESVLGDNNWDGIRISRTDGKHGRGEMSQKMGHVSGFVLEAAGEPTLYIAGDTVWCDDVEAAMTKHQPEVTIVNAGAAQFLTGGVITMDKEDILQVCEHSPATKVVAVHMEAWSHCLLKRSDLSKYLLQHHLQEQVYVPLDGETIQF